MRTQENLALYLFFTEKKQLYFKQSNLGSLECSGNRTDAVTIDVVMLSLERASMINAGQLENFEGGLLG